MMRTRLACLATLCLLSALPLHGADTDYPSKPIRLIVGHAPGSGADGTDLALITNPQESARIVREDAARWGGVTATGFKAQD